jgi:N-acetyl-anhydromuramyl-L-alanine amidase AmpD
VRDLRERYRLAPHQVFGHCEADPKSGKTCPNIDMIKFRNEVGQ